MKLKYYGTAAAEGWPALFCDCDYCRKAAKAGGKNIRTRSQALINQDLLIDFPPDTYYHVLNYGLNLQPIKNIIITHAHEDHYYPQDLHMTEPPYAYTNDKKNIATINIFGNKRVGEWGNFEHLQNKGFINYTEVKAFEDFKIITQNNNYKVTPLAANHDKSQDCFIYIVEELTDLNNPKKILYGNDTGYFPDETWDYLIENKSKTFDYISLDCTTGIDDCRNGHMGYLCGIEVKERLLSEKIANEKTQFCWHHFSHNSGKIYDELVPYAKEHGFMVSHDNMEILI